MGDFARPDAKSKAGGQGQDGLFAARMAKTGINRGRLAGNAAPALLPKGDGGLRTGLAMQGYRDA